MVPREQVELVPLSRWTQDELFGPVELGVEVVKNVIVSVGSGAIITHPHAVVGLLPFLS